ncbi:VWA domain-containing protein [Halococcus thailandensis]|uniref:VWA containing CoxE-like protein n=1 Tax=Halococcus thailandensis JCM 13552 TaxID=1227457 RepID=M0N4Q7_9EURY|nr:VWA domain-containing protein [Halococcus thailandensis]EMA52089.1 VWA containing CoxE-like protein [Halococcus thailandensis JCM 13552]
MEPTEHVREELVRFVRALRRAGVSVPANAGTTAARALVAIGFDDRERARVGLRASLVPEQTDVATFDELFAEFWRRLTAGLDPIGPAERPDDPPDGGLAPLGAEATPGKRAESDDGNDENGDADESRDGLGAVVGRGTEAAGENVTTARYSPTGRSEEIAAFAVPDEEGFDDAFDELTRALAELAGRRWTTGEERPDVRRALRTSVGTGGAVVDLPRRERARTALRVRVVVDVSRSVLDVIERPFLLRFLQQAHAAWRDTRVFFFDEDFREVTESFDTPSSDAALAALERAEAEWGGGTHIGESLDRLRTEFPYAVDRRSVLVVVSDGLEMGDVSALERAMAGLSRTAAAVLWLNPLAASSAYEPSARGMAAALPYLDGLFAFAGPADLADLARQLRQQGSRGVIGYEHDRRRTERRTQQQTTT